MTQKTFLIMAGGTGGHIFPGLAVAHSLEEKGHKVLWLGAQGAMETTLVPKHNIHIETVAIKGIRGNGLKRKLTLPFVLFKAVMKAKKIIQEHQVDAVIGFGGFAAFPGGVAAKLSRKPIIIHEQNAVAGLVNKTLAKIATKTLFAFPGVFPSALGLVGNPVRKEIATLPEPAQRFSGRVGPIKLLVVGGSLGAKVFNQVVPEALSLLNNQQINVLHQCGKNNLSEVQERYQQYHVNATCQEFIHDMQEAYAQADIVLCRSGALTIAELAACGLGSILVPFPFAVDDHQSANAQYLVRSHASVLLPQDALTASRLAEELQKLDRQQCLDQAQNARALALPDAADKVAQIAIATVQ
ncbi:undecaprenyldiphospho-muramoylpentapeptide beta-N-acetylglucosaminyltransferase [Neisseria sp. Ec49-e6-T10]|uniref:undecaprenyldiphospho-muramoylpentapeptide beta-N-acetylglucosaminyltransferase n=1 Tax=Neisseria sp. Ec49-e6-T10 TaxID=3140744 RepID=UPI003EBF814F